MASSIEIIRALGGNEHTGMCKCPAHDDRNPSLSVRESNGKLWLKCFSGCTYEEITNALRMRGLWGQPVKLSSKPIGHEYADEINTTLDTAIRLARSAAKSKELPTEYLRGRGISTQPHALKLVSREEMQRITGKNFPAMLAPICNSANEMQGMHVTFLTRDSKANCVGKEGKLRRMYGRAGFGSVMLAPPEAGKPIVVGEGIETTLSAMQSSGLPGYAALSADNLEKFTPPPTEEVIIAVDNDERGKVAAESLANRLTASRYVVRLAFPPEKYGDWNDALQNLGSPEKLAGLILNAKRFERPLTPSVGLALRMEEVMQLAVPPRHYLLRPWLRSRSSGMIHAPRGAGKTWLALAVAYAVASGKSLLGWDVVHTARTMYVDAELDLSLVQERLRLLGPPTENLYILSFDHLFHQGQVLPDLGREEGREFFDRLFEKLKPELVVFDSLTYLAKVAENEAEAWDPIAEWILKHRRLGRTILFVHHQGRSGKARGTTKREDGLEVSVSLKPKDDLSGDNDSAVELTFDKHREFFGKDAAPRIIRFSTSSGVLVWEVESVPENTKKRVAELFESGMKAKDIAKELDIHPSRVSQIKRELSEEKAA